MTVTLKLGVCDLFSELTAHAQVIFRFGKAAGAIPTLFQYPFPDLLHRGRVFIVSDLHCFLLLFRDM